MEEFTKRRSDSNFIRQLWEWATPWGQIIGFVVMCAFVIGGKSEKFDAQAATLALHDQRITSLEATSNVVNGKLDVIINGLGIKHR